MFLTVRQSCSSSFITLTCATPHTSLNQIPKLPHLSLSWYCQKCHPWRHKTSIVSLLPKNVMWEESGIYVSAMQRRTIWASAKAESAVWHDHKNRETASRLVPAARAEVSPPANNMQLNCNCWRSGVLLSDPIYIFWIGLVSSYLKNLCCSIRTSSLLQQHA